MKKIVLIPSEFKDDKFRIARRVIFQLRQQGAEVYVDKKYTDLYYDEVTPYDTFPEDAQLIVVMGGDGTVLDIASVAIRHDIPIVGINLGRLGYLSTVEPDKLSVLSRLFSGKYTVSSRMLLSATLRRAVGDIAEEECLAVNDIVICHRSNIGISEFTLIDTMGNCINYRADGIIMSTPTGSSAYSLSAGGPLVDSTVDCIVATPICPHSFFNRSIIFSPTQSIVIKNTSERGAALTVCSDGREHAVLEPGDSITVTASQKRLKMVDFSQTGMLNTLRRKMEAAELRND